MDWVDKKDFLLLLLRVFTCIFRLWRVYARLLLTRIMSRASLDHQKPISAVIGKGLAVGSTRLLGGGRGNWGERTMPYRTGVSSRRLFSCKALWEERIALFMYEYLLSIVICVNNDWCKG